MLVEVEGGGGRRSRERVLAVQDWDADVVEAFADLKDVWLNVSPVRLGCGGGIGLEDQRGWRGEEVAEDFFDATERKSEDHRVEGV